MPATTCHTAASIKQLSPTSALALVEPPRADLLPQVDVVAGRVLQVEVHAQVELRRLDAAVAQVERDLLYGRPALVRQLGIGAPQLVGPDVLQPDLPRVLTDGQSGRSIVQVHLASRLKPHSLRLTTLLPSAPCQLCIN